MQGRRTANGSRGERADQQGDQRTRRLPPHDFNSGKQAAESRNGSANRSAAPLQARWDLSDGTTSGKHQARGGGTPPEDTWKECCPRSLQPTHNMLLSIDDLATCKPSEGCAHLPPSTNLQLLTTFEVGWRGRSAAPMTGTSVEGGPHSRVQWCG